MSDKDEDDHEVGGYNGHDKVLKQTSIAHFTISWAIVLGGRRINTAEIKLELLGTVIPPTFDSKNTILIIQLEMKLQEATRKLNGDDIASVTTVDNDHKYNHQHVGLLFAK